MELHNAFSYQLQLNSLPAFQFESIPVITNGSIYFNLVIKNLNSTPIAGIGLGTFAHHLHHRPECPKSVSLARQALDRPIASRPSLAGRRLHLHPGAVPGGHAPRKVRRQCVHDSGPGVPVRSGDGRSEHFLARRHFPIVPREARVCV